MNGTQTELPPKRGADWFAWSLQLVFGLVVGAAAGVVAGMRMTRLGLITVGKLPVAIVAVSLFGGAMTSYHGDRIWYRPTLFGPDPPAQSQASRASSVAIGGCGVVLFLLAIFSHLAKVSWSGRHLSLSRLDFFLLLMTGIFGFLFGRALRTGSAWTLGRTIDRDQSPLEFWLYVFFSGLSLAGVLLLLLR